MKKVLIAGQRKNVQNYIDILNYLGADPVVSLQPESVYSYDALLLPGGGDICPSYFEQPVIDTRKPDPELDRLQFHILYQFLHTHKPILGICKGMQLLNVFFGGDLKQHLDCEASHQWNGADQWHDTSIQKTSILGRIYGTKVTVNSAHHQSIGSLGQDLCVIQSAKDHVPEAISHEFHPLLGVQWHPERMCLGHKRSGTVSGTAVFEWLLDPLMV